MRRSNDLPRDRAPKRPKSQGTAVQTTNEKQPQRLASPRGPPPPSGAHKRPAAVPHISTYRGRHPDSPDLSHPLKSPKLDPASSSSKMPEVSINSTTTVVNTDKNTSSAFKSRTTDTTRDFLTKSRFDELDINDLSKDAINDVMNYEFMTKVQHATLPVILEGHDVLAKAKTGTGKTVGFLLPTIEKIYRSYDANGKKPPAFVSGNNSSKGGSTSKGYISSLVLSPTRELAQQIADEAHALTEYWEGEWRQILVYGGTNIRTDQRELDREPIVDLLVATPGRLLDHLENTKGVAQRILDCPFGFTLILDEADQLLEMGFRDSIVKIIHFLPLNGDGEKDSRSLFFGGKMGAKRGRTTTGAAGGAPVGLHKHFLLEYTRRPQRNTHEHTRRPQRNNYYSTKTPQAAPSPHTPQKNGRSDRACCSPRRFLRWWRMSLASPSARDTKTSIVSATTNPRSRTSRRNW